jgi:hypothetical protein
MSELIFECPRSGERVQTGIVTDPHSFSVLSPNFPFDCPHCRTAHALKDVRAWLLDSELTD